VLNTLLSRKLKRHEAMASLTENDMTLIQEIIKLKSPLKVATTLLSEEKNLHYLSNQSQIAETIPTR